MKSGTFELTSRGGTEKALEQRYGINTGWDRSTSRGMFSSSMYGSSSELRQGSVCVATTGEEAFEAFGVFFGRVERRVDADPEALAGWGSDMKVIKLEALAKTQICHLGPMPNIVNSHSIGSNFTVYGYNTLIMSGILPHNPQWSLSYCGLWSDPGPPQWRQDLA